MNRLIIIGNGFDIAHGIKTSYQDYVLSYLKLSLSQTLNNIVENNGNPYEPFYHFKDELIEIKIEYGVPQEKYINQINNAEYLIELIEILIKLRIKIDYHFKILETGLNRLVLYNWVDFETEYFNELHKIRNIKPYDEKNIINLNNQFDFFKKNLEIYLKSQQDAFTNKVDIETFLDCFCESIFAKDVDLETISDHSPGQIMFLNFNYTNTLESYLAGSNIRIFSEINYIHGSLNDENNLPIFGFGDEVDKRYKELEEESNNELFRHIKTFGYLKTSNYSNLTRFLAIDKFQVQIFGHSCGLSDRTMFKEIFEHKNCLSIKMFYHQKDDGSDDYTDKTYEIYRHFSDKNNMRNKVVDKQRCKSMPQPNLFDK